MTKFPKLKRALVKANRYRGHWHAAYMACDDTCTKNASRAAGELEKLQNRKNKINGIKSAKTVV